MINTLKRAKKALWDRYREVNPYIEFDKKGYLVHCEYNLLEPKWMNLIKDDYEGGDGNELKEKFRAIHSSAALVANHFARFKKNHDRLTLLGYSRSWGQVLLFDIDSFLMSLLIVE